jgi:Zn finger protein HypA/HybF involved in hydrogenase expression
MSDQNPQTCDECGGSAFRIVNDSILKRRYPFVAKGTLKMCDLCGAKYLSCAKCGALLTRVHLSLDVYGVRSICPICGEENPEIAEWITRGGG